MNHLSRGALRRSPPTLARGALALWLALAFGLASASSTQAGPYDGVSSAIDTNDIKVYCTHRYSTKTASGYCWQGRRHTWDFNQATYFGGGYRSSPICAVLVGYYSRSLYYSDCDYGWVNTGYHLNLYTFMDAGVYNGDGHSVTGAGIYSK